MEKISFGTMNWARGRGERRERNGGGQGRMRGCLTQEGRWGESRRKDSGMQMHAGIEGGYEKLNKWLRLCDFASMVSLLMAACGHPPAC